MNKNQMKITGSYKAVNHAILSAEIAIDFPKSRAYVAIELRHVLKASEYEESNRLLNRTTTFSYIQQLSGQFNLKGCNSFYRNGTTNPF